MPTELRRIILSADEVGRAVTSYRRIADGLLPDGNVDDINVNRDGTLRVTVNMNDSTPTQHADFDIDADHTRDILIRFCLENNIPIPRNGEKKSLESSGHLVLQVRLSDLEDDTVQPASQSAVSEKKTSQTTSPETTPT